MNKNKLTKKGFTLIELLVVIAIIGVLASVVLASLNTARRKSRDAKRIADIKQIQLALEMMFDDNGEYPDAIANINITYLAQEPRDPSTAAGYSYDNLDDGTVTGGACAVADANPCLFYHLGANIEDTANAVLDSDMDICAAAAAGCTRVVGETTLSGIDGGGATPNDCVGALTNVYCYDVAP